MTERIKAILDAVTDRVLAYRPADKGQQAKKVARRMKRQRKKEARRAMTNDFGSHLYKSPLARITALEAENAALRDMVRVVIFLQRGDRASKQGDTR